jgi:hypothetical protein
MRSIDEFERKYLPKYWLKKNEKKVGTGLVNRMMEKLRERVEK